MTEETAIEATGVGKKFRLSRAGGRTLKSAVLGALARRDTRDFWALREAQFSVRRGETLGIIGANGAGKSTLLSLVAGTIAPTTGRIETRGTISSLLELGAGFHPDFTGRENVFLYGAILGLSRRQIRQRFDAIVSFAEVQDFVDQPVRHYSSGMYVRLAFAVAVEVDPEILLIDEVLAVGDAAFQAKCVRRIEEFRKAGKTMLIVSHDLGTIRAISDRILLLREGRVVGIGQPDAVVQQYEGEVRREGIAVSSREWGTGEARILSAEFLNEAGQKADRFRWGDTLRVRLRYKTDKEIADPVFGFSIADSRGRLVYGNNTQIEQFRIASIAGEGSVQLVIPKVAMARGAYLFSFSLHSSDHRTNYHRMDNAFSISVDCDKTFEGTYMPCHWAKE